MTATILSSGVRSEQVQDPESLARILIKQMTQLHLKRKSPTEGSPGSEVTAPAADQLDVQAAEGAISIIIIHHEPPAPKAKRLTMHAVEPALRPTVAPKAPMIRMVPQPLPQIATGSKRTILTHPSGIEIDRESVEVRIKGRPVKLTLSEFRLLELLVERPGVVLERSKIVHALTGGNTKIVERNVDVHIRSLRIKLGEVASLIRTVRGIGYSLSAP